MHQVVKTPEELFEFLKENITYGVIDKNGKIFCDSESEEMEVACFEDWKMRTPKQIINDGIGHCYDYTEVEREWFEKNGFDFKTFWVCAYNKVDENDRPSHAYLVYKDKVNSNWVHFEVSDGMYQGLHTFKSLKDAVIAQANHHMKYAKAYGEDLKFLLKTYSFKKPKIGMNMAQYMSYCANEKNLVFQMEK